MRIGLFIPRVLAVALVLCGSGVFAETLFTAELNGALAGTDSPATGLATLILNDSQDQVTYHVEYSGLTSPELAAHFHRGAPGEFGPILLTLPVGSPKDGTWVLGPNDLNSLLTGRVYVNVHTDNWPGGEIRGDFDSGSVATDHPTWGDVKSLFR